MKKSILNLVAILIASLSFAQGGGFNYKALITDNGNVLNTQTLTFKFTVLENGTTSVYQETQTTTTDANGIVAVNVGEGTLVSGNFNTIDWGSNPYFLKVEIDTGSGYQDFGTTEFKAVPYAKFAEKAGNAFSGDFNALSNVPAGLSDGDDDTHLTEAQVDNYVSNNGYLTQVDNIRGIPVSSTTPNNGQVLKYNGTQFVPADDDTSGGSGTDGVVNSAAFSGTTTKTLTLARSNGLGNVTANFTDNDTHLTDAQIGTMGYIKNANDADHDATNELQDLTLSNTQLSISNGNNVNFTGWDTDASDDFSGDYDDLSNKPAVFYENGTTNAATNTTQDIQRTGSITLGDNIAGFPFSGLFTANINPTNGADTYGYASSIGGSGAGIHVSVVNLVTGDGSGPQYGSVNEISNSGDGVHCGTYTGLLGDGSGYHYGNKIELSGDGSGDHYAVDNILFGTGTGDQYGVRNYINNSGNGDHYGIYSRFTGTGEGDHYGAYYRLSGTGTGEQYGTETYISNSGNADHYGAYYRLTGTGTGKQYGTETNISNSGNADQYGNYSRLSGSGTGNHYGAYNKLTGAGTGLQYGTMNNLNISGDGDHFGSYSSLSGSGSGWHVGNYINLSGSGSGSQFAIKSFDNNSGDGNHYGAFYQLSGTGAGSQFGISNHIDNSGNAIHYGIRNTLSGTGTGNKYGTYNRIESTAGGTHYAVYGDAQKAGSYAGYFLGSLAIIDGTQGNGKVLTSDGSGKASWVTPTVGATQLNELSDAKNDGSSIFIGTSAGANSAAPDTKNVGVGSYALQSNTTGEDNVAYGTYSLSSNTVGGANTAIGSGAGFSNQTGSRNIFLGCNAGYNETGSDKLYIENSSSATPLIGGDFSTDEVVINGELGIGVTTPDEDIHVKGGSGETIKVESTGSSGSANIELATNGAMFDYFKMSKYGSAAGGTFGTAPNQLSLANLSMLEVGTGAGAMAIRVVSNNPMYFITGNEVRMTLEADGDLDVKEKLTAPDSGDADMKAYIYGNITSSGNKRPAGSSDGFSVSKTGTGVYDITFASTGGSYSYTVIATIGYPGGVGFIRAQNVSSTKCTIRTYNTSGTPTDKYFTFVMYKK